MKETWLDEGVVGLVGAAMPAWDDAAAKLVLAALGLAVALVASALTKRGAKKKRRPTVTNQSRVPKIPKIARKESRKGAASRSAKKKASDDDGPRPPPSPRKPRKRR